MTRNQIKSGYTIQLNNGNTYIIYMVKDVKFICVPRAHNMCLKLENVCNEDLSPLEGISPIVKIWDDLGNLVYKREETVTISIGQIAEMLNIPVEKLRIKV